MKCISLLLFITIFGGTWRLGRPTCVLESDFGFTLNCAFKKSGLFRVRNLGGVKAHIGLGFSLGDELGFKESISNVELNRRRSAPASKIQAQLIEAQQNAAKMKTIRSPVGSPSIDKGALMQSFASPMSPGAMQTTKSLSPPSSIPAFKPIPPAPERPSVTQSNSNALAAPALMGIAVPAFSSVPSSISRLSTGTSLPSKHSNIMAVVAVPKMPHSSAQSAMDKMSSTNFALRTLPSPNSNELTSPITKAQPVSTSLQALLAANNVSEDALELALLKRQQMFNKVKSTTETPHKPITAKYASSIGKVMNAPREYYPVGYDKNFDDNFASRVDLPETSFSCGDQKYFPGLYSDEDLGCMVFHVCALTDDGLIMKSFLCPESTLFDMTILKCNWWFYTDCKYAKKLYDSNIPISKSYQLIKALTFFSNYKKEAAVSSTTTSTTTSTERSTITKD